MTLKLIAESVAELRTVAGALASSGAEPETGLSGQILDSGANAANGDLYAVRLPDRFSEDADFRADFPSQVAEPWPHGGINE